MNIEPLKTVNKNQIKKLNDFLSGLDNKNNALNVNQTSGFFTAILSAPSLIMPSMHNPIIFGGNPTFESEQQSVSMLSIVMGLRNTIAAELTKKIFNLLLWEKGNLVAYKDASLSAISDWCQGYCTGAQIDPIWMQSDEAIAFLLPFSVLADQFDLTAQEDYNETIIGNPDFHKEQYRSQLPTFIKDFYKYWEEARKLSSPVYGKNEMLLELEPTNSPDELCPCGSNKKFIDCCKTKIFH